MRARTDVPAGLLRLAREQTGVISRAQAAGFGLTAAVIARLLAQGSWGSLERGIFLVPDIEPSWLGQVWAATLLGGFGARAAGRSAARLDGLLDEDPSPIEILIPFDRRCGDRSWVVFRRERDRVRSASTGAQPSRTRIADTVIDLCAGASESSCVDLVTKAVQRRLVRVEDLLAAVGCRKIVTHRTLLTALLADVAGGVHSTLEFRYLVDVERAHGLPTAQRQQIRPGRNGFLDVLYAEYALVVELDGRIGHVGEGKFRDRARDNAHTKVGLRSLRFGWHEVAGNPCGIATDVAELLIGLGWNGLPSTCARCR